MKRYILIILALILAQVSISAQESNEVTNERAVIVHLKSGSVIEGELNEWVLDEYIDLETAWADSFRIHYKAIDKVIQKSTLEVKANYAYRFKEKGLYYSIKTQIIKGNAGGRARNVYGLGLSASAGMRYSRWFSIGAGVGFDNYIWDSGENLVPLFLETTSFLSASNTSLFTNVQAGYSLAFTDDERLITEAKGGLMLYPAIGLRFGKFDTKYTLDLGYKFQKAQFTYLDSWRSDRHEQRLLYKRLTLRFGILL